MLEPDALETLLDRAREKVLVVDERGTVSYANAVVERVLGYDRESFVGTDAFAYVHPADRGRLDDLLDRLLSTDESELTTEAYRYRTADGDWLWLESDVVDLTDTAVGGIAICSRDVTERVEAERERERTAVKLSEIAAKSTDVLWMFDAEWEELLFVNDAFEEMYGLPTEVVFEDPRAFLDAIHPEDQSAVLDAMVRLSSGESAELEYRVHPGLEYRRWVWVQAEPVIEDGEVVRIVGFTREITDRRRRERQLQVMDTLLRHNLRNDMNVILGHADLAGQLGDEAVADHVGTIIEVGRSLLATAEKQRDVIELLTSPGIAHPIDLAESIRRAIDDVEAAPLDVHVDLDLNEELVAQCVDGVDLALRELVDNAVSHADGSLHLEISGVVDGESVVITVADDCPPIADMEYHVLTGDHAMNDVYHGGGLGMWLVHWAVDLSDGDVDYRRSKRGGNEITLTLPRPRT